MVVREWRRQKSIFSLIKRSSFFFLLRCFIQLKAYMCFVHTLKCTTIISEIPSVKKFCWLSFFFVEFSCQCTEAISEEIQLNGTRQTFWLDIEMKCVRRKCSVCVPHFDISEFSILYSFRVVLNDSQFDHIDVSPKCLRRSRA